MSNIALPNPAQQSDVIAAILASVSAQPLTPPLVTVTPLVPASTTYTYEVVAKVNGSVVPSAATSTTTGAASLSLATPNVIAFQPLQAPAGVAVTYDVYRTVGGSTQGRIAIGTTSLSVVDSGLAGDGTTPPAFNTSVTLQEVGASGAITIGAGKVIINGAGVVALTLALPIAGAPSSGGQDGNTLQILSATAHAHTVTTPANGINGADDTATFSGTLPNVLELTAYNGKWWSTLNVGAPLTEV
jgi:hypothetical protein